LARLGEDREEVSPVDRRRGAEGLGHPPRPIQEVRLVHSRARLDQRKPAIAPLRKKRPSSANWAWPEPTTSGTYRLPSPIRTPYSGTSRRRLPGWRLAARGLTLEL
jgi:hypothetical protein